MFKNLFLVILVVIISFLCSNCSNTVEPNYDSLYELVNLGDAISNISISNDWHYTYPRIESHITQREVIIKFPDGRIVSKSLPDSLFYLAIAPYINYTHLCDLHYTSSCEGELANKQITLDVEGYSDYKYKNEQITTMKNGFFEIWLPRNKTYNVKISYEGKSGQELISTNITDRTCITSIKLQ